MSERMLRAAPWTPGRLRHRTGGAEAAKSLAVMLSARDADGDAPLQPKLRVLHIIPRLSTGGAETMMVRLIAGLDRSVFDVSAVSLFGRAGSQLERDLEADGVPLYYTDKKRGVDLGAWHRLNRIFKAVRPDVVHTHLTALAHSAPALFWHRHAAVLHTVHSLAEKEASGVCRSVHRAAFVLGVRPVAIAKAVADSITRVYDRRGDLLIPNGVPLHDSRDAAERRGAFRREHGFDDDAVVFVTAGRLMPEKNQALLVDAFASAFAMDDRCHLVIAGEGGLAAELRARANAAGVGARVHLLGLCLDMAKVYGGADAFVLSSDWEGHPLSVMEAMAAGLPVISTSVGGVPEIVTDGVTGILVRKGDCHALSQAMLSLSLGADRRIVMGRSAAHASRAFDVGVMTAAYASVYRELAARATSPASSAIRAARTTLQEGKSV